MVSANQFTPTEFDSAKQKAKFVKHFIRFIESDFSEELFPKWFYTELSNTFGHIAHYNREGFFDQFFRNIEDKLRFLRITLEHIPCGCPAFTYSDAEQAIQKIAHEKNYVLLYKEKLDKKIDVLERAELERLKAKYDTC